MSFVYCRKIWRIESIYFSSALSQPEFGNKSWSSADSTARPLIGIAYSLGVMGLMDEILSSIIGRIALATAHVWIQRNNRTHQGLPLSEEQLVKGHS
jgi:hypothetical protein